jgi:hypothetical protein
MIKRIKLQAKFDPSNNNNPIGCFSQLDNAIESACLSIDPNASIVGTDCVLSEGYKEQFVTDVFNNTAKKTALYSQPDGSIGMTSRSQTDELRNTRCNGYPAYPSCPSGWVSIGTRRSRNSGIGDGCGLRKRKYSHRKCRFTSRNLGFLFNP